MNVIQTTTKTGRDFWYLVDNDGEIIVPVFKYLKHLATTNKSKNTLKNQAHHLKQYFEWLSKSGLDYISAVKPSDDSSIGAYDNLVSYKLYLAYPDLAGNIVPIDGFKAARKDSTVNNMMSTVISFYEFLTNTHEITGIPVFEQSKQLQHSSSMLKEMYLNKKYAKKSLLSSKVTEEPIRFVTQEEFDLCYSKCNSRRDKVIISLMFYGGLRCSEVCGLMLEDFKDLNLNRIYIVNREHTESPDAATKYNSIGTVVIDNELRDLLLDYISEDLINFDTNYFAINMNHRVHTNPNTNKLEDSYGKPMRADTIRDMVERLGNKCGLERLTPHMFRHGLAMRMLYARHDMTEIQDMLRHKHVETTASFYAKYDITKKIDVQERLAVETNRTFSPLGIDMNELAQFFKEDDLDE